MNKVNVDFVNQAGGQGEVANMLVSNRLAPERMRPYIAETGPYKGKPVVTVYTGGNPKELTNYRQELVTNATLRRDEWKQLDEAVLAISQTRLVGIADLVANNLVYNLGGNGMGTTVLEYHDISDALVAELTMDGVTRAKGDRPEWSTKYLPIPIIHSDYEINARVLEASRKMGNPMDTTLAEKASRKVSEKLESMLFTSTTYAYGGSTIYSYLNHNDRNQITLSQNWDASGKTGAEILDDVISMKQASIDAKHYGPWMIYVPTAYEAVLDNDYGSNYPKSIRARILEVDGIKGIKVVDTLTANNVIMVQMTIDVVRLVRGMGIQNVEWQTEGKMITRYKVMTIQVPQVRSDQDGNSGLVHLAAAA